MLRRAGAFTTPENQLSVDPRYEDSEAVLESKWKKWSERESFKRWTCISMIFRLVWHQEQTRPPPLHPRYSSIHGVPKTASDFHNRIKIPLTSCPKPLASEISYRMARSLPLIPFTAPHSHIRRGNTSTQPSPALCPNRHSPDYNCPSPRSLGPDIFSQRV